MLNKIEKQVLDNFVVIEGLDGAGTTTQLQLIEEKLKELSIPHLCTFEPTDSTIGRVIRSILKGEIEAQGETIALLFAADRYEHIYNPEQGMAAHLARGRVVVCDRYLFSSLAYQGSICDFDRVLSLNNNFPLPRHLVFLDTPIALSQQRLGKRKRREIFEPRDLQPQVLSGYLKSFKLYENLGMELHWLKGSLAPDEIFEELWSIIASLPIVK
ncbi:Thymidylate kinase [subsurface metagenome]